jgi:hypothetical protein
VVRALFATLKMPAGIFASYKNQAARSHGRWNAAKENACGNCPLALP